MKKIIISVLLFVFCYANVVWLFQAEDFDEGFNAKKFHSEVAAVCADFDGITKRPSGIRLYFADAPNTSESNVILSVVSNHTSVVDPFTYISDFTEEQEERRLILTTAKYNLVGYLYASGVASNLDQAKGIGKPFMRQFITEMYGYESLDFVPLLEAVSNATNSFLTNTLGPYTIKQLLLNQLDQ